MENENYQLSIIPVIIPFDETGALETVLLSAIESEDEEGAYVAKKAKAYIDDFCQSDKQDKYLKKRRLITKAKFSAAISITNPDRSTAAFNALLMSHDWEKNEVINHHFSILNRMLEKSVTN